MTNPPGMPDNQHMSNGRTSEGDATVYGIYFPDSNQFLADFDYYAQKMTRREFGSETEAREWALRNVSRKFEIREITR